MAYMYSLVFIGKVEVAFMSAHLYVVLYIPEHTQTIRVLA